MAQRYSWDTCTLCAGLNAHPSLFRCVIIQSQNITDELWFILSVWIDESSEQLDVADFDSQDFHTLMKMMPVRMTQLRWRNAEMLPLCPENPAIFSPGSGH